MNLDDVRRIKIPRQKKHRVGRGQGSGWGTTSGRGHKGAGQRSGTRFRLRFEGGQMPIYRRLPKKGFNNKRFQVQMHVVNVGDLEGAFSAGDTVDLAALKRVGLAPKRAEFVKVLGFGELTKGLTIHAHGVSAGAKTKIEAASGTIELHPVQVEHREKFVRKPKNVATPKAAPAAPAPAAEAPAPEAPAPEQPTTDDSTTDESSGDEA